MQPFRLEDCDTVRAYLNAYQPEICELAMANLIIWQDFDRPQISLLNDNLCILIYSQTEPPFFLEPIGKNKIMETMDLCLEKHPSFSRASKKLIQQLNPKDFHIKCLRAHCDYVYDRKKLAELKGKEFDGKRNHIKKFTRRHPHYQFVPLRPEDKKAALELFEKWFSVRQESRFFPRLAHIAQKKAVEQAFLHFEALHLIGGALKDGDALIGFTIGSQLNTHTASVHFAYADPSSAGSAQSLLSEACNKLFNAFPFVNLEQDLGIPGLRKAKLSYHPLRIEKKYEITRRGFTSPNTSDKMTDCDD
ncbi:MAG: phosphatidylglycerol lysyltransferase domain-containing protein [Candidatus Margulisiibacteriota bacterium]